MDQEPDLSEQLPREIRHQIEETRSELTEKLEALEQKVMNTVADATSAVRIPSQPSSNPWARRCRR